MSCYYMKNAQASESRLMGVVGLYIHWALKEDEPQAAELSEAQIEPVQNIHQAYCFELEEDGLDRVSEELGTDVEKIAALKNGVFGGLGSKLKRVTDREAFWMIKRFSGLEASMFKALPAGVRQVFELAAEQAPFTEEEEKALLKKLCVPVYTQFGWVNYYLMRSVCKDMDGVSLTVYSYADPDAVHPVCLPQKGGLVRNRIDIADGEDGDTVFCCESVVDTEKGTYVLLSELTADQNGVTSAKQKSYFRLSEWETYRKLLRPEYLTYFRLSEEPEAFDERLRKALPKASCKLYDAGELYMDYNPDNSHVERPIFNIGDDLQASYFITTAGQLVMASFTAGGILAAEVMLRTGLLDDVLEPLGRYTFTSPVLGRFVESGYDDFGEFLKLLI